MTPLTRCDLCERSRTWVRPAVIVKSSLVLIFAAALALAATDLRFRTRDLQIESSKLQKRVQTLVSYKRTLISRVEELKRYERLRQYAETQLGLRESRPGQGGKIALSPEAVERWSAMMAVVSRERRKADQPAERMLAVIGEKVISWSSVSVAREAPDVK